MTMNAAPDVSRKIRVDRETFRSLAAEEIVDLFARCLEEELVCRQQRGLEGLPLKSYLKNLFSADGKIAPTGIFGYSQRLALIIEELRRSPKNIRILDSGCGYGTESLLFSLFPCKVWAVDLVAERVALGRSRIDFFQTRFKSSLDLTFVHANIFRFLKSSPPFDIIWAMEAISHIYPLQKFFDLRLDKMKTDGKLIISDPNGLNPLALIRSFGIRGSLLHKPHRKFLDPETRRPTEVGQEKILNIFRIRRLLDASGFKIKMVDFSGFMGSSIFPRRFLDSEESAKRLSGYQRAIKRIPFIRSFGSIDTLLATKKDSLDYSAPELTRGTRLW